MGKKHNSQLSHRESILFCHKLTPCIVSKKNWNTKDKNKFMMHVLYILWLVKKHISGQSGVEQ